MAKRLSERDRSGDKSGELMTVKCKIGLKVNLMWGGNRGKILTLYSIHPHSNAVEKVLKSVGQMCQNRVNFPLQKH